MKNIKSYTESLNEKTEQQAAYYDAWNAIEDLDLSRLKKIVIDKGFDPDAINQHGYTLLHLAAEEGPVDIIQFLVDEGFDIYAENLNHETPLHLAAQYDHVKAVKRLLQLGSPVNAGPITPLHMAVEHGNFDTINALLDNHANVDARDQKGNTPLHYSINPHLYTDEDDQKGVIDMLLERGADVNSENDKGETPLQVALQFHGDIGPEIIIHLIESGAKTDGIFRKVFANAQDFIDKYGRNVDALLPYVNDPEFVSKIRRMQRGKRAFGM